TTFSDGITHSFGAVSDETLAQRNPAQEIFATHESEQSPLFHDRHLIHVALSEHAERVPRVVAGRYRDELRGGRHHGLDAGFRPPCLRNAANVAKAHEPAELLAVRHGETALI